MSSLKIVSLLPSTTELACSLGLEANLVAVSHECDYPSSISHLERITSSIIPPGLSQLEIDQFVSTAMRAGKSLYAVDAEKLVALDPDIVLTQGLCDVCAVTPETMEASLRGVRCTLSASCQVLSMNGTSLEGICTDIRRLADLTDRQEQAEQLIAAALTRWNNVKSADSQRRLLLLEWIDPFFSAGHWVPQQASMAGCLSVIGSENDHSRRLTRAEVAAANPDHIAVVCCGFNLDQNIEFAQRLYQMPELQEVSAVQKQRVWAFDANAYFSRPTLRIVRGSELIFSAVHHNKPVRGQSQRIYRLSDRGAVE